jgi:acetyl-CoA synthetase
MHYPYQIKNLKEYHSEYQKSINSPELFWESIAEHFTWKKKWDKVLDWNFDTPSIEWYKGAKLNITENCLDRHLPKLADKPAIIWESNNPDEKNRTITYSQLHLNVCEFAQVLKNNSIKKGDRVCIYMGMIPELAIAMLACARIGAIHSIIFAGFSAQAIADRVNDAHSEFIITCDGSFRGAKSIDLKGVVDEAISNIDFIKKVIVFNRTHSEVNMKTDRDVWWHEEVKLVENSSHLNTDAEEMDAEDPLFILYTSGSTGKPKGVVHSTAGYMVWTNYTFVNVFQYKPGQVHFCTADIGWITGHSYIVYGPLSAGATTLMFEGVPTWPNASRFWDIVDKYKVDILYTAPTAIRSLMGFGLESVAKNNLTSLKVLGTVGEPINEEAWQWYHDYIGKGKCPIVDTWWQTETGGILISNLAGVTPHKPTFATLPLPGIQPCLVDENGKEIQGNDVSGNLCIKFPWPGMIRTTYNDHERCKQNYFSTYPQKYFTGDGCLRDKEGNYRITGRVDDVLNVSGHRIGTAELENAINMHDAVIESAVVGYPHDIKGQGIYAYVICENENQNTDAVKKEIIEVVSKVIGAIAKPDKIQFVPGLPKTRSGKIMRRILRKIAEGDNSNLGDTSTLLDPSLVDVIKKGAL